MIGNGSFSALENSACEATSSAETPKIETPAALYLSQAAMFQHNWPVTIEAREAVGIADDDEILGPASELIASLPLPARSRRAHHGSMMW